MGHSEIDMALILTPLFFIPAHPPSALGHTISAKEKQLLLELLW